MRNRVYPIEKMTCEDFITFDKIIYETKKALPLKPTKEVLGTWDKNKKTLCRLLDGKLQYEFDAEIPAEENLIINNLTELYAYAPRLTGPCHGYLGDVFVTNFQFFFRDYIKDEKPGYDTIFDCVFEIENLFFKNTIQNNRVYYSINGLRRWDDKVLKIPAGTKALRAIRRLLEFYEFPYMHEFYEWRDKVSVICTNSKSMTKHITLSIHPNDFLTMSDNACDWSSCMSMKSGSYSNGCIEMMNSNMVVMAYVKSKNDFEIGGHEVSNKSWRCLFYCHKDIICSGREYPFSSEGLVLACLTKLQELAKKNLGWSYQYGPQRYLDDMHYADNAHLRNDVVPFKKRHAIVFYTGPAMYNDFISDISRHNHYMCVRNYVEESKKLNVSGPCTCLMCGQKIDDGERYRFDRDYLSYGDSPFCSKCLYTDSRRCDQCGYMNKPIPHYEIDVMLRNGRTVTRTVCRDCLLKDYVFCWENKCFAEEIRADVLSPAKFQEITEDNIDTIIRNGRAVQVS